jgi:hypothetical protein
MINREIPTKNWLSFPIVGTKGFLAAASQTSCSDDSISVTDEPSAAFPWFEVN